SAPPHVSRPLSSNCVNSSSDHDGTGGEWITRLKKSAYPAGRAPTGTGERFLAMRDSASTTGPQRANALEGLRCLFRAVREVFTLWSFLDRRPRHVASPWQIPEQVQRVRSRADA